MHRLVGRLILIVAVAVVATPAFAADVQLTIKNEQGDGSFFFTPFWVGFHNGQFDSFDSGAVAPPTGITEVAEAGDTSAITTAFMNSMAGMAGGVDTTVAAVAAMGDPPVFSPGESTTTSINIGDATVNRYFSFASMVIPSNDLFVGNDNPTAYQVFDNAGNFTGPVTIQLFGGSAYDNGSEVNDASGGAAFSANGGTSTDESNPVRSLFSDAGDAGYLASFLNSTTASGDTITSTFDDSTLIATITIVPEPASAALLALVGFAMTRRRRTT